MHYGYGLNSGTFDGNLVIGHSGGMVGYYAHMMADLDAGFGACAIVNGVWANAPGRVTRYALELFQAMAAGRDLPAPPPGNNHGVIEDASPFVGTYRATDGSALTLVAEGETLLIDRGDDRVALEPRGNDVFFVPAPGLDRFLLSFGRDEAGVVVEAFHGPGWYTNDRYAGPTTFDYPDEWNAYPGHYRSYNPWFPSVRVMLHKGQLMLLHVGGSSDAFGDREPLTPLPDGTFRVGEDLESPERATFDVERIVDGQCLRLNLSGQHMDRFFMP
jgi:hypothetical protein